VHCILRMNPLCKCKASKSPTLHTWHLSYRNESKVARSLGWVALARSGGDKGAFTFCRGNFLNSQIVKAKGRTGLRGNDSKLTLQEIYPVWPRNDAFPQLLISKYCIYLHRHAVRQQWFKGQHMITFPVEYNVILFFVSALRKFFWHHLSKLPCTLMKTKNCHS
jgi:hypothetical protein